MRIFLGADHAGFQLKEEIKTWLKGLGYVVEDEGAFTEAEGDDYPDFVHIVAQRVLSDPTSRGLVFGGSGQGEAMVANRYPGIRAAVYYGPAGAKGGEPLITFSRLHNDANVLSLGARFVETEEAKQMIKLWLGTEFSGDERHARRIAKIESGLSDEHEF